MAPTAIDVLLMRHGEAVDDGPPSLGDDGRWLTGKGRVQTRAVATELAVKAGPLAMWTSPLVRAVQTAEIVAGVCGLTDQVRVQEALSTRGSPREVLRAIGQHTGPAPLILVGHEPGLSLLAQELLGAGVQWPGFRKSGVLAVKRAAATGAWGFVWSLDPRTLVYVTDAAQLGG